MPNFDSPVFTRCHQLLTWLIPLTLKFPRQQRFVLAQAVQRNALDLQERLVEAAHATPQSLPGALSLADIELDKLRRDIRLCAELNLITTGQYEHAATLLAEMGRLIGGWRRGAGNRA